MINKQDNSQVPSWLKDACVHGKKMVEVASRQVSLWQNKNLKDVPLIAAQFCKRTCELCSPVLDALILGRLTVAWISSRPIADLHARFLYAILPPYTQDLHSILYSIHGLYDAYKMSPRERPVNGIPTARQTAIRNSAILYHEYPRYVKHKLNIQSGDLEEVAITVHNAFEHLVRRYFRSGQATKDFRQLLASEGWQMPFNLNKVIRAILFSPHGKVPAKKKTRGKGRIKSGIEYGLCNHLLHGSYMTLFFENSMDREVYSLAPLQIALSSLYPTMFVSWARALRPYEFFWRHEFLKHNEASLQALPEKYRIPFQ